MDTLTATDGLKLHLRRWPPPGAARGTVQIVHGLSEHIERYQHLAGALNAAGWGVVGHDHRGHGRSEGKRGSIPDSESLLKDLALVIDAVGATGTHVLLGQSMGGVVASRFVAEGLKGSPAPWWRAVDALVLVSPALALRMNRRQRLLLRLLGGSAPDLGISSRLDPKWISRDAGAVEAYRTDPLNHARVTARLVRFIKDNGDYVRSCAAAWRTPTLLLWAGTDGLVDPAGSRAFANAAPSGVVASHEFPELFHELFNEPEREQVIALLLNELERFARREPVALRTSQRDSQRR